MNSDRAKTFLTRQLLNIVSKTVVVSIFFIVGLIELNLPLDKMVNYLPWVDGHPLWFTRILGVVDILGASGILIPSIFGKMPNILKWTAVGCASKQCVAILYHSLYGVPGVIPVNLILLSFSLIIIWGAVHSRDWSKSKYRF